MNGACGQTVKRNILFIALFALIIGMTGCAGNVAFSGSKTGNDHQFLVDFDILNSTVASDMRLSKGETVETVIAIEKGSVDIIVKNENGTIAYQGNDAASCTFSIGITESGTYTFSITGRKATGSVHFIKSGELPEKDVTQ